MKSKTTQMANTRIQAFLSTLNPLARHCTTASTAQDPLSIAAIDVYQVTWWRTRAVHNGVRTP
jgi:hypothetical protein